MSLRNDCFALPQGVRWTPVAEAMAELRARAAPVVAAETVALEAAAGRIVATPVAARLSNPPSANAAVDGYGYRAPASGSLRLLEGRAAAGAPYGGAVPAGAALRVLTGAPIPEGVDTVVMQEDVAITGDRVDIGDGLAPGANVRGAGEDVAAGAPLFAPGRRLTPADIAQAAAVGCARLPVFARLRVGLFSTGDELTEAGETPGPGQIPDANRPMLAALLTNLGVEVVDYGRIPDDATAIDAALTRAARECQAVATSGGASGGDEDHISRTLAARGAMATWRIAMKPGRPLALGVIEGTPVFGLPGNPVAAFVTFLIFARPAILRLAGADWPAPIPIPLRAAFAKKKKPGRVEYLRGRLTPEGAVEAFHSEGSGLISGLRWSDGLIVLEHDRGPVAPDETVGFLPYAMLDAL